MQVHLLVRSGKLRASGAMQDRVFKHSSVDVHFHRTIDDAFGDSKGHLSGLKIRNHENGGCAIGSAWLECLKCPKPPTKGQGVIDPGWLFLQTKPQR